MTSPYQTDGQSASSPLEDIRAQTLGVLSTLLKPGDQVALIDFPNHRNHGDHLIYLGELAYLDMIGIEVKYVADPTRYSAEDLRALVPEGPVLLHGGGSFGDRWTETQAFRERVVSELHDRRIIQLPQSIEFSQGPRLERAKRVYGAHPDLIHLMRDRKSFDTTRILFAQNTVMYCPDMAFGYTPMRSSSPERDIIHLRRTDSESVPVLRGLSFSPYSADTIDWHFTVGEELKWKMLHIPGAIARRVPALRRPLYPLQRRAYDAMARLNVNAAVQHLSRGRVVVTDRLHATVLAALLRIPVVCMDNANGKISSIASDYLSEFHEVYFAESVNKAEEVTKALAASSSAVTNGSRNV